MDYKENFIRLEQHFEAHPEEYEGIAKLKTLTSVIEEERSKRRNERLERVAEFRRRYEQKQK